MDKPPLLSIALWVRSITWSHLLWPTRTRFRLLKLQLRGQSLLGCWMWVQAGACYPNTKSICGRVVATNLKHHCAKLTPISSSPRSRLRRLRTLKAKLIIFSAKTRYCSGRMTSYLSSSRLNARRQIFGGASTMYKWIRFSHLRRTTRPKSNDFSLISLVLEKSKKLFNNKKSSKTERPSSSSSVIAILRSNPSNEHTFQTSHSLMNKSVSHDTFIFSTNIFFV